MVPASPTWLRQGRRRGFQVKGRALWSASFCEGVFLPFPRSLRLAGVRLRAPAASAAATVAAAAAEATSTTDVTTTATASTNTEPEQSSAAQLPVEAPATAAALVSLFVDATHPRPFVV